MTVKRIAVSMFSLGLIALGTGLALSQDYPNRPVRIVAGAIGSTSDYMGRVIAQRLTGSLGQQVIVENRPSAVSGADAVAKAQPDGYSLLLLGSGIWVGPLFQEAPYDPVRDLAPISLLAMEPNVIVVHPSLPVSSIKELIALAKARPGELNYASGVTGGSDYLAGALFAYMAGINIVHVSYSSGTVRLADLLGGQTQMSIVGAISVAPHVKSGRLRALAVTSAQPSVLAPGLPTVAAAVPGYESVGSFGMFAPAKTPTAIINRLSQETVRVLSQADLKQKFLSDGQEIVASSPEQFAAVIKSDMARWGKLIKDVGIKPK